MEELIKEFEKVMEAYNDEFTSTNDEKDQLRINNKYESIINEAEKTLESKIEYFIKSEEDRLEKESNSVLEIKNAELLAEKYLVKDIKKVAKKLDITYKGTKLEVLELILNKISFDEFQELL